MPLLRLLGFVAHDLHVSYRASGEPQDLFIDVKTAGIASQREVPVRLSAILAAINAGAAGGDMFHPADGAATVMSSPSQPNDVGPDYHFHLRVAGVAPGFLRTIVEELRFIGFDKPVLYLSIVGSLPLDGSSMSIDGRDVRSWLDDPDAYLVEWPTLDFELTTRRTYGASICIELLDPFVVESERAIRQAVYTWIVATQQIVGGRGEEIIPILHYALPKDGSSKTGYRAMCEEFLHRSRPSRAVLVNILMRSHRRVPIRSVEIGLP